MSRKSKLLTLLVIFALAAMITSCGAQVGQADTADKPAPTAEEPNPAEPQDAAPGDGNAPDSPPRAEIDYAKAAEALGISEDELKELVGESGQIDYAAVAEALGITEDALMEALGGMPGGGRPMAEIDYTAAAETLGITEDDLKAALGDLG